jgi:pyruvate,water dikinase
VSEENLDGFPYGAVAVSRLATPALSPVLRRASALITEVGASIGHLAAIARELRVPAIFGAARALELVPEGMEVTVDAGERLVYKGIVEPLLACRSCSAELFPSDPEYVVLRRLLKWIMPLEMINPDSGDFSAENCRTYHDIIHFAHERSVEELLHIQDRGRNLANLYARKLELDTPIDIFVLDIGGGASTGAGSTLSMEEVHSAPFRAFLGGLTSKEMWSAAPASVSLKDIFSGIDRTFGALAGQPEYAGRNHAIIAKSYMNVGLRLGYHFSVIDSYLGSNVNQNYIYFRFVGGFADERRRRRRAELIRAVLEDMHFKVTIKGDLVVGKFKIAGKTEMIETLRRLGELTGFTRQLDLSMKSEEAVEQFAMTFRQKAVRSGASHAVEEQTRA